MSGLVFCPLSFFIRKEQGWSVRLSTPSHLIHAHEIFKSEDGKGVGRRDRGTWRGVKTGPSESCRSPLKSPSSVKG